jgi:DNA-binding transcriptional regulator YiaG
MSQQFPFNSNDSQSVPAAPCNMAATWKPIIHAALRGSTTMTNEQFVRKSRREYPGRLRYLRKRLKLSEAQAAEDHDITLRTYRRWEAGHRPHDTALPGIEFCKKHGLALDYYFMGKLPMKYPWHRSA